MQSDLAQQEKEYEYICSVDARSNCAISRSYSQNWDALNESSGEEMSIQRDAWRKLRDGLEPYSKYAISLLLRLELPV